MTSQARMQSSGPGETRRLGARLARLLRPGDVVLLSGDLGAGKTVFVQGMARGLGYAGWASSKSFVLLGVYLGNRGKLYHADLYRLEAPEQAEELGLEEAFGDGALAVEWPERALPDGEQSDRVFPADHLTVRIEATGERTRTFRLAASGPRSRELLTELAAGLKARR
jgi:tRNA threonylcarbamoyladenosine biosynthesis protein TsaE